MEALLESLRKHGYAYEVLGFGQPWNGFRTKMENYLKGVQEYQTSAGPDALAVFLDAFDTYCIKSAAEVAAAYRSKPRPMPILFGAEICCYTNSCNKETLKWYDTHNIFGGSQGIRKLVKNITPGTADENWIASRSVFLNSGLILGTASHLQGMFQEMVNGQEDDDQRASGNYMIAHPDLVDLDLEEAIFRNKIEPREPLPDEGTPSGPGFIHFPGMRNEQEQAKMLNIIHSLDR
jgi:hypothetical protein